MNKNDLLAFLSGLAEKNNAEFLEKLESRKLEELTFHDAYRDNRRVSSISRDNYERFYGNKKFYNTVALSTEYVRNWIEKNSPGKIVLDYACGNGFNAIRMAKAGAELAIGIDISEVSINNSRAAAREEGVCENSYFLQADCEHTLLPDNSIDLAICSGMLHHLDLSYAFYELRRILKPSGRILVIEALDHNPLIKLYRNITPQMRTEWEKNHILSYRDIDFARRFFAVENIRNWHLFSIAGAYLPGAMPFLNFLDRHLLKMPGIRKMSWMITFEMRKLAKG